MPNRHRIENREVFRKVPKESNKSQKKKEKRKKGGRQARRENMEYNSIRFGITPRKITFILLLSQVA